MQFGPIARDVLESFLVWATEKRRIQFASSSPLSTEIAWTYSEATDPELPYTHGTSPAPGRPLNENGIAFLAAFIDWALDHRYIEASNLFPGSVTIIKFPFQEYLPEPNESVFSPELTAAKALVRHYFATVNQTSQPC